MRDLTGGPAFPIASEIFGHWPGMTLREYYAGIAMNRPDVKFASLFSHRWAARIAFYAADAMLAARSVD